MVTIRAIAFLLTIMACSAIAEDGSLPGAHAPNAQASSHPGPSGRDACRSLFAKVKYVLKQRSPLMSLENYMRLYKSWPPADQQKYLALNTLEERSAMIMKMYGLVPDPYPSGLDPSIPPLPMGLTLSYSKGAPMLHANCLLCHGGTVQGAAMPGIGVNRLDFHNLMQDAWALEGEHFKQQFVQRKLNYTRGIVDAFSPAGLFLFMRDEKFEPRTYGGVIYDQAVSGGSALAGSVARTAASPTILLRDPLLTGTVARTAGSAAATFPDIYAGIKPAFMKPTSWLAQVPYSNLSYFDGSAHRDIRQWLQFDLDLDTSNGDLHSLEPALKEVEGLMEQCALPPSYAARNPQNYDEAKAKRGEMKYNGCCKQCHGGMEGGEYIYPERMVSVDKVGTDRARADALSTEFKVRMLSGLQQRNFTPSEVRSTGYRAPTLVRIADRPPYLHNGAVPTLAGILFPDDATLRPKYWDLKTDENDFDPQNVGFRVNTYTQFPPAYRNTDRYRATNLYDTTNPGHANTGHRWACINAMSADERREVLEYLKGL